MPSHLPTHVGFIPDGNRRWAERQGRERQDGYAHGIEPGLALFEQCRALGLAEVSVYGFTQDNTRRSHVQVDSFRAACTSFALAVAPSSALLVLGDEHSAQFPAALKPFRTRQGSGIRVNFLVNYGWQWDLDGLTQEGRLRSHDVGRLDLIVRWGGGRRLSGFLPVQSVYADIHVIDALWPEFQATHLNQALNWFTQQDRTLGG